VAVFDDSVSREHAVIREMAGDGWTIRDLGSRNGTHIDNVRVEGRAAVCSGALVRFGDVSFCFLSGREELPAPPGAEILTADASGAGIRSYLLRDEDTGSEILVLEHRRTHANGAVVMGSAAHRRCGESEWSDIPLTPLEFELLRTLCQARFADKDAPGRTRGAIPTRELARTLSFQSDYANEENVRQLVKRLRSSLRKAGIERLVEAVPRRGYFLCWMVELSAL
jgi:hypothetical protein